LFRFSFVLLCFAFFFLEVHLLTCSESYVVVIERRLISKFEAINLAKSAPTTPIKTAGGGGEMNSSSTTTATSTVTARSSFSLITSTDATPESERELERDERIGGVSQQPPSSPNSNPTSPRFNPHQIHLQYQHFIDCQEAMTYNAVYAMETREQRDNLLQILEFSTTSHFQARANERESPRGSTSGPSLSSLNANPRVVGRRSSRDGETTLNSGGTNAQSNNTNSSSSPTAAISSATFIDSQLQGLYEVARKLQAQSASTHPKRAQPSHQPQSSSSSSSAAASVRSGASASCPDQLHLDNNGNNTCEFSDYGICSEDYYFDDGETEAEEQASLDSDEEGLEQEPVVEGEILRRLDRAIGEADISSEVFFHVHLYKPNEKTLHVLRCGHVIYDAAQTHVTERPVVFLLTTDRVFLLKPLAANHTASSSGVSSNSSSGATSSADAPIYEHLATILFSDILYCTIGFFAQFFRLELSKSAPTHVFLTRSFRETEKCYRLLVAAAKVASHGKNILFGRVFKNEETLANIGLMLVKNQALALSQASASAMKNDENASSPNLAAVLSSANLAAFLSGANPTPSLPSGPSSDGDGLATTSKRATMSFAEGSSKNLSALFASVATPTPTPSLPVTPQPKPLIELYVLVYFVTQPEASHQWPSSLSSSPAFTPNLWLPQPVAPRTLIVTDHHVLVARENYAAWPTLASHLPSSSSSRPSHVQFVCEQQHALQNMFSLTRSHQRRNYLKIGYTGDVGGIGGSSLVSEKSVEKSLAMDWEFYTQTIEEMERIVMRLSVLWRDIYEIPLSVMYVNDPVVGKKTNS
jgi:hypothetical protein